MGCIKQWMRSVWVKAYIKCKVYVKLYNDLRP